MSDEGKASGAESTEASAGAGGTLDWRCCWYPVTFVQDLPADEPYGFTIYDHRWVLFRDKNGDLQCLQDRCPHRSARLSDGRVDDGVVECLYHGWRFGSGGRCLHIPQMEADAELPAKANVPSFPVVERQGVVWVWPDSESPADESALPLMPELDRDGVSSIDYMIDLPYDQSYLVENVIDIAHIHVAHDGVRGGGSREHAKPLEFEVAEESLAGIRATFRTKGLGTEGVAHDLRGATVEFVAPNLIRYGSQYRDAELISGLALYSLPCGRQRCRLIYRAYSNFWTRRDQWRPRWLEHRNQTIVLEQDMQVVVGQHDEIERSGRSLQELWLPIKTSDVLVLKYRQWLDRYGRGLPMFRGLATSNSRGEVEPAAAVPVGRYEQHTRICSSCSETYRRLGVAKQALGAAALAGGAVAVLAGGGGWTTLGLAVAGLSLAGRYGLTRLETLFR